MNLLYLFRHTVLSATALVLVITAGIGIAQEPAAPAANLLDGCVTDYDPEVDYFPEQITITDAENFTIEYFNNYKVVTITDAFDDAPSFTYVLVQCGTPAPDTADFPEDTQFIDVPAEDIITMSTTQLPHLIDLDLLDRLVGLDTGLFVSAPEVRALIEAGELVEIGSGAEVNVELALVTEPDLIMTYGFDPTTDAFPVLVDAGIFTALNAEWREVTPLARAEWIKYTGVFFNAEARAEAAYANIASEYNAARELAASVTDAERQVVLWNAFSTFSDAWFIPGAETYVGALLDDAGAIIALGEEAPGDSAPLSFEVVYDRALDADVWMVNLFAVNTLEDLLAQDSRYGDFAAVEAGNVWNNSRRVNANGGNDYFELGVTNPHLILQDLVHMLYPDLLPDH
ncbi:MAG: ABC transporter substrate-binding protein [Chloroflexi bacterium]|nr:ABC transporter substrate-binding protein [Chloroflexota bacterium]